MTAEELAAALGWDVMKHRHGGGVCKGRAAVWDHDQLWPYLVELAELRAAKQAPIKTADPMANSKWRRTSVWDPIVCSEVEAWVPIDQGLVPGEKLEGPLQQVVVVFAAPPGPADKCVFVEVEDGSGNGLNVGKWEERPDGFWELGPFLATPNPTPNSKEISTKLLTGPGLPLCWRSSCNEIHCDDCDRLEKDDATG